MRQENATVQGSVYLSRRETALTGRVTDAANVLPADLARHTADLLLLACKTDPKARGKGVSLILVETDRPGFQRGRGRIIERLEPLQIGRAHV